MILLIDNFDSFSYNLCQMLGSIDPDIRVVRNNAVTISDIRKRAPSGIVLSPARSWGSVWENRRSQLPVAERSVMQNELSTASNQRSELTIRACSSKDSRTISK